MKQYIDEAEEDELYLQLLLMRHRYEFIFLRTIIRELTWILV